MAMTPRSKAPFITVAKVQYGLKPVGEWFDWENERGDPVKLRTVLYQPDMDNYRMPRFVLDKAVHERLVECDGYYLFILYKINSCNSIIVTHHSMRPASDLKLGTGKKTKIHPRDVLDGVKG